eukprot:1062565-Amphidinium_carterae.2
MERYLIYCVIGFHRGVTNAEVGYARDYQNKQLPVAVKRIKRWQQTLATWPGIVGQRVEGQTGYVAAKVGKRL